MFCEHMWLLFRSSALMREHTWYVKSLSCQRSLFWWLKEATFDYADEPQMFPHVASELKLFPINVILGRWADNARGIASRHLRFIHLTLEPLYRRLLQQIQTSLLARIPCLYSIYLYDVMCTTWSVPVVKAKTGSFTWYASWNGALLHID